MSIWHDDAVWRIGPPFGDFDGAADIRHALEDVIWPAWRETHHWTTNLTVAFDGPDSATRRVRRELQRRHTRRRDAGRVGDVHRSLRAPRRAVGDRRTGRRDPLLQRCARRRPGAAGGVTAVAGDLSFGLWYDFRNPEPWAVPFESLYRSVLDQIADAEQLGIDSVWLTEHHFCDDGYTPSPLVIAASIAERTSRLRIGTNLMLLPLHDPHPPRRGRRDALAAVRRPVRPRRRHGLPAGRVRHLRPVDRTTARACSRRASR